MTDEPDNALRRGEVWQLPGPWQSEEEPLNTDSSVCETQISRARRGVRGTDPRGAAKCVGWQRWHGDRQGQEWGQDSLVKPVAQDPLLVPCRETDEPLKLRMGGKATWMAGAWRV